MFGVKVKASIRCASGKLKRQGRFVGRTPETKKAFVTLTKDSKTIEFLIHWRSKGGYTMAINKYKPTSPGRRGMTVSTFEEITCTVPEKSLLEPIKKTAGVTSRAASPCATGAAV